MKAAIYARKSTDDTDKGKDNQSITRQIELATAYALGKGWTIEKEYIFTDDGISGTKFPRPGLSHLIEHLSDVDVVVMMNGDRLGRDQEKTPFYRTKIRKKAKLYYYQKDEEATARTPIEKYMEQTWDLIAAMEVELASQRSREALARKAKKGYNTGGSVYGYDNVWVYPDGRGELATPGKDKPKESHTEYRINKEQADTINRIYKMYADGHGMTSIAKALNGDPKYKRQNTKYFGGSRPNAPAHGTKKGVNSWPPSSVRKILHNDRYIGYVPFGQYRNKRENGKKTREKQEKFEKVFRKDLVIVPKALWDRVQIRLAAVRATYVRENNGEWWGRPPTGQESKYLLTGLARCEVCGASMIGHVAYSGAKPNRKEYFSYVCSHHRNRGSTVCDNNIKPKMPEMDSAVIDAIQQSVLSPADVSYVVRQTIERIKQQQQECPDLPDQLRKEIAKLKRELDRFMGLIAGGNAPESVLQEITTREDRIKGLEQELAEIDAPADINELDMKRLEKALQARMRQFSELLRDNVPRARQALGKLLEGPIWVNPRQSGGYELKGNTRLGALLPPTSVTLASPRGFEPLLPP